MVITLMMKMILLYTINKDNKNDFNNNKYNKTIAL